ncbi:lysophospholipid acyltransferase family protein [Hymenobacter terrenus]|uniref:lysophospholipid acyltransferase family protein n=1 Tax=Hymenobacter terrenus TaxID=1629124 RepID=UPI0006193C92|nr:lysophospholipid acyltransferase family protein [Hymenobacter terrenus]
MRGWFGASLRLLFVVGVAYPVVLLWLGIHVRHRERLPSKGPAIIAANHNSHLDILTLLSLFPLLSIPNIQPAAAADYFHKSWWLRWFSRHVIGIIPVVRGAVQLGEEDPLTECYRALEAGKVLVIFPEGTRGQPEQMAELKAGIWYLAKRFPHAPVVPVYMHGLGKSMPKGTLIPVPFYVKVAVGNALRWVDDKAGFMHALREQFHKLRHKVYIPVEDD